jgi:hypothetical protein
VLAELLAMREASGRRLEQLRVRIDGDASPSQRAAAALVRSSGVQLQRREAATLAVADAAHDAPADEPDFVLDLSAPIAAGRLTVPGAPAVEQARIAALLADNQRVVLQAVIVNVLG